MKKSRKVLIIVIVVLFVLGIVKDLVVKSIVTVSASNIVGARVTIDSMAVGIFKRAVRIKGFKLYNPPDFPKEPMLDLPEVSVEYDLGSILKGNLHLPLIIINLKEMVVIRNQLGKLNVDSLKVAQKKDDNKFTGFIIDQATLKLGKVIYKDYSKGEPPTIQAHDIGVDKTFKDIKSPEQFAALIMVEAMGPTAIKNAAIYGAATILGVGFLPAGVAGVVLGKDDAVQQYSVSYDKAYAVALEIFKKGGEIKLENKATGQIKGKLNGADVTVDVNKMEGRKTEIKVTARQYLLPKPEVSNGFLYQVSQKIK